MPPIPVVHLIGLSDTDERDPDQPNLVRVTHSFESVRQTLERMNEVREMSEAEGEQVTGSFSDPTAQFIHLDVDQIRDDFFAEYLHDEIMDPHGILVAPGPALEILGPEPIIARSEISVQGDTVGWGGWGKPTFDSSYQSWPVHRSQLIHALLLTAPDTELDAMVTRYGVEVPGFVFQLIDGRGLSILQLVDDKEVTLLRHHDGLSIEAQQALLQHPESRFRQQAITLLRKMTPKHDEPQRGRHR